MKLSRIVFASLVLNVLNTNVIAQTPFFWDDFDRESVWDTDIIYRENSNATLTIDDGSVIIQPLVDKHGALPAETEFYADVRLRTQVRFLDVDTCGINPWVGLLFRDVWDDDPNGYWAGPSADGRIHIGETTHGDGGQTKSQRPLFTCEEMSNTDIHMQLDAVGDTISFTSWLDGTSKPESPQLVMQDDSQPIGNRIGVILNPPPSLTGLAIRYFAMLPALDGDYNGDGALDVGDLDLLFGALKSDPNNRVFDLVANNVDPSVDLDDVDEWLSLAATSSGFADSFLRGDTNLDGTVNATDLNALALNWQSSGATWSTGDFTGEGNVGAADLNELALNWQQSISPAAASVPEPAVLWQAVAWLALVSFRRLVKRERT